MDQMATAQVLLNKIGSGPKIGSAPNIGPAPGQCFRRLTIRERNESVHNKKTT